MKNFLFLLDELPPTQSANGICADKVIDELLAAGHKVSCICWGDQTKNGISIYKIKRKMFDRAVLRLSRKNNLLFKSILLLLRVFNRIAHVFTLPWWPAESFETANRFYKKAVEVIEKDGITDVIAISYPGETLIAMTKIKRKYKNGIRTIMYPLDVTLFGTRHGTGLEKTISKPLNKRFMIKCGKFADKILVLENARCHFDKTYPPAFHEKFINVGIPLLIPKKAVQYEKPDNNDIHIAFAGNLLTNVRDPSVFFRILDKLAEKTDGKIFFDLYGKCDKNIENSIKTQAHGFTFVDHGWVNEEELHQGLSKCDILANIGNNSTLIPSKLFVYLSYGKPIIHQCVIKEDACLYYLEQYDNCYIIRSGDISTDQAVIELSEFIAKSKSKNTDVNDLFESCTPHFTARMLEEN